MTGYVVRVQIYNFLPSNEDLLVQKDFIESVLKIVVTIEKLSSKKCGYLYFHSIAHGGKKDPTFFSPISLVELFVRHEYAFLCSSQAAARRSPFLPSGSGDHHNH